MKTEPTSLAAAYRRRILYSTIGIGLSALTITGTIARAQDKVDTTKSQAHKTDAAKPQDKTVKKPKKPGTATLKVVPIPRKPDTKAADPAAPPTGANPGVPPTGANPGAPPNGGNPGFPSGGKGQAPPGTQPGNPSFPGGDPSGLTGRRNRGGAAGAFSAAPGTKFTFDFHGADIAQVLRFYAMSSGLTITADPALTGPVTIINPKQVTLDEAFRILQEVLRVRGFTAQQQGDVMSIQTFDRSKSSTQIFSAEPDVNTLDPRNQVMTQVIPLENVDADALAKDLLPLISPQASLIGSSGTNSLILTDTSSNIRRFIEMVSALDKTSSHSEMKLYPLYHAEAANVAATINDLYKQITSRGKGAAAPGPGQPGFTGQPPQPGAGGSGARPAVVAVPDTRTNSVFVVASPDNQEQIAKDIISRLDDVDAALDTETVKIKYSNAVDVANLVNNVLSNLHGVSAASGGGGSSFNNRAFGGFNPFGFGGGGGGGSEQTVQSTDPFGKVIADQRTNSVFITALPERMVKIKDLIKQIDVDVPVETTTFVLPLKNAQASDVAYALGQAFQTSGSNQGSFNSYYNFGGGGGGSSSGQRQPISRRLGGSSGSTFGTGRAARPRNNTPPPPNPPDGSVSQNSGNGIIVDGIPGVMTANGFVPTGDGSGETERTRQFFGFGRGGRGFGGGGGGGGQQYGRGSQGNFANLLQLQNNVYVTASPDGESVIVTTSPENYQAVKALVDSLDIVPRQVMIEVIIAEVTLDTSQKFGFNLNGALNHIFHSNTNSQFQISAPASGATSSTALDATATGLQSVISGLNYSSIIQALNADSKVKVLSTPRIFTSNNQAADIENVTNIPYINGSTPNGIFSTTNTPTVTYLKVGLTLNVTPRITRDGKVTIDLQQEASDLIQFDVLGSGANQQRVPRYNDRYADTSVTIQDGQTVVVGGIIRSSDTLNISKIPLLGDIPILGQLFRSHEKLHNRVELMIFMTPHIVDSVASARQMTQKMSNSVATQIPDLVDQQPNLKPVGKPDKNMKKSVKPDASNPGIMKPDTSAGKPGPADPNN